jgi:membrane fusion protein (multidrug efflux system)
MLSRELVASAPRCFSHSKQLIFKGLFLFLGVILFALTAVGCGSSESNPSAAPAAHGGAGTTDNGGEKAEDAIPVHTAAVRLQPLSSLYSTSATLRADRQAIVKARTQGVIQELFVEEGDTVTANQPLARLENDEQVIAAERARVIRDTRVSEFDRIQELHGQGMVSEEEFETKRRELEEAKQDSALRDLELSRTTIRAPFSGMIVRRHLDVGATVNDGTDVYDIADLDPLYADVNVPERHVLRLEPDQTVRLAADATAEVVSARIERIAPSVDPATGTVKVTLAVIGETSLRPGAFVRVDIVTDTHLEALVVPRSALVAEGRRWHMFRLDEGEETVEQLEVSLGYEEGEEVEILQVLGEEAILEQGQSIVSVGAPALTDGARVRIMEPEESTGNGDDPLGTS